MISRFQRKSTAPEDRQGRGLQFPARPLLSSQGAGWKGVAVEEYRNDAPGERDLPPVTHHTLVCRLGKPFSLLQERCGQIHEGIAVPNTFCLTPAGQHNHIRWRETTHTLHVRLDPAWISRIVCREEDAVNDPETFHCFGATDPQVLHIALALRAELESGCLSGPLYAESLATALAVYLLKRASGGREMPEDRMRKHGLTGTELSRVREYIGENLGDTLTLADLAAQVCLSPYHFSRLFKQSMGLPPHQYIIFQRVERAKGLLREGELTAGEVAYAVGFGSQGHLNFHFKRLVGVTPRQFTTGAGTSGNGPQEQGTFAGSGKTTDCPPPHNQGTGKSGPPPLGPTLPG